MRCTPPRVGGRKTYPFALFSADAITLIHNASRGYPRAINNLAVNALTAAYALRQHCRR